MLFNSLAFLIFLPIVFIFYWFLFKKSLRLQNLFLLAASYFFYGWWDWRFVSLIAISSIADFLIGKKIYSSQKESKKRWLYLSIGVNIGILAFFKYFDFFVNSFIHSFGQLGIHLSPLSLNIILPIGISFYTFQTLSYSIDIYKGKLTPSKDWISFFAFVSFFPQLVAGPIERAINLLPQFEKEREFNEKVAADGLRQMLWGFFKKIVIADNCAVVVNDIFNNYQNLPAGALLLGAILFSFQIYCDFSGYSDIAIGTARLFGINLKQNFAFPYFSRDIGEFWRRWHISLSQWFRDYLYIPLGGNRLGQNKTVRNILIVFLVSGLWHGANWTFIAWGAFHALLFLPMILSNKHRSYLEPIHKINLKVLFNILSTFLLVSLSWIFFRSENLQTALDFYGRLIDKSILQFGSFQLSNFFIWIIFMIIFEWMHREKLHGLQIDSWPRIARWTCYLGISSVIFLFGNFNNLEFIYFAF